MYKIYADKTLIYDSTIDDYKIGKGSISLETNKSGSFTFSVYPDHFYYGDFVRLKTVITVYKSEKIVFRGRILNDTTDYWNNKTITCEGELGFLQDSIIRPFSFTGTPEELFKQIVTAHNAQVDEFKRFKIGDVTVFDPNSYIARSNSSYESAFNNINSRLIEDSLGGYIHITHGEDGTDPIPTIHYLSDFNHVSTQTIEFGSNLKNYTKTVKANDIATAIIPLGHEVDDGDDSTENLKLTIANVNGGIDYVYNEAAVATYGWIFKVVSWDDVTDPNNLKTKAEAYLQEIIKQNVTIELNAIDLHLLNASIESFKLNDYIRVVSEPHDIAQSYLCKKQTLDLLKPENDTITLGYTYLSFSENTAKLSSITQNQIISIQSANNAKLNQLNAKFERINAKTDQYKIAEQQLTSLMAQSFGVFKSEEVLADGSIVSYMHNKPKREDSTTIWKMTENAFAVSTNGGKTWNAGLDSSGNVLVNVLSTIGIEATWINTYNLAAICAYIGDWEIGDQAIFKEIVDPNDSSIVYRVRFKPEAPINNTPGSILECQKSTDGGRTYTFTSFSLFSDGTIQCGDPSLSEAYMQLRDGFHAENGKGLLSCRPDSVSLFDSNLYFIGGLRQTNSGKSELLVDDIYVQKQGAGSDTFQKGVDGEFTSADGKNIVVKSGVITSIR